MGLSVGVVSIDYDHNPPVTVRDFLTELSADPDIKDYADEEGPAYLSGVMDDVGLLDVFQDDLMERAEIWCGARNTASAERDELLNWLSNLPWKAGIVRLHLVF